MCDAVKELFASGSVTVPGLRSEFGISHSVAYELMQSGKLPFAQMGRKRLIPRRSVIELLAGKLIAKEGTAHVA
ncbi:MAG: hypothetical protein C0467_28695 [Planctomycetaceae bacterium]|nr:hypothetical protein [Planctomycetaceae bacterium]